MNKLAKLPGTEIISVSLAQSITEGIYQDNRLKGKNLIAVLVNSGTPHLSTTVILVANKGSGWQIYQNASYNISGTMLFNPDTGNLRYSIASVAGWSASTFKIANILV